MDHDSRRWTGRYKPGEGSRPLLICRRWVPWLLGSQMLLVTGLAVAALLGSATPAFSIYFFLYYLVMIRNCGLSPFNHRFFLQLEDCPCHDEFERSALERATRFAYAAIVLLVLVVAFTLAVFIAEIMIPFPRESTEGAQ